MIQNIQHPRKECVPLAVGLAWGIDGSIYQEKLDGVFTVKPWRDAVLVGETVRGEFIAFDCVQFAGEDVRARPLLERLNLRDECAVFGNIETVPTFVNGGKLLESVLARGGEGICKKLPNASYYEAMTACKRLQTWRCTVTAINYATGGASIAEQMADGRMEDRGTVPLRNRAGQCRVGSIVKVEGECLSAGGMILKPRPCKDTPTSWMIQF